MSPFMFVSGSLELVLEVFAVLLKTLESPESSPTVPQIGLGGLHSWGPSHLRILATGPLARVAFLTGCSGTHLQTSS